MERLRVRTASSSHTDAIEALAEVLQGIEQPDTQAVILYCSADYDLDALGAALQRQLSCPVLACTTAGEIGAGGIYIEGGMVALSLASQELSVRTRTIHPLHAFRPGAAPLFEQLRESPDREAFGLLLIDGLSMLEEQVTAALYGQLQGIPLVGGSAGDGLSFRETKVYHDGRFASDTAVVALFETSLPFKTFRIQHFEPTSHRLVITGAHGPTRTVTEINGKSAALEYARAVGLEINELSPQVFATHPVMLRIGGDYFVRSIQKVNEDGSLTFYCAIDNGLVLTVAKATDLIENLRANLGRICSEVPGLKLVLGCDCILRRLELVQTGQLEAAREVLAPYNFIGFSTYGEQFNGIHVNQTLTGVALGS